MRTGAIRARSCGFTLVELLTVVGLMALLVSLFLPVLSKVRAAANTTSCVSNLRQLGAAWTAYLAEHHGRLPEYAWRNGPNPEALYSGYWTGIVEKNGIRGDTLVCPAARTETERQGGGGSAFEAWSGKLFGRGTAVCLDDKTYRVGSYGYNGHLVARGGFGKKAVCLSQVGDTSNVPAFFDSTHPDATPALSDPASPPQPPPDLRGATVGIGSPEHWRFLIGRHGRGINVYMADGSVRWVRVDDTYQLTWSGGWKPSRLNLPVK